MLDRSFLTVPDNEYKFIRPLSTMVGGKMVKRAVAKGVGG
jgi:hypothetical protein